jgi:putative membrane protein
MHSGLRPRNSFHVGVSDAQRRRIYVADAPGLFWGLVIAGLIVGLRWLVAQGRPGRRDEALEILRQRYARGDIDKQEFEARKRDLGVNY